ncbi:hypothetical protein PybrP1_003662 [[Pythium] brassicae (nom. inval.)]|nr:hypothetical protein PybrP1_003662 [[Pythium] brassicae (nom. inval.)]
MRGVYLNEFWIRSPARTHLGDSNAHLNVRHWRTTTRRLARPCPKYRGSISAEHGVGVHKPSYLHLTKSSSAIALMVQLKTLLDPNGILNPYKVLPSS